MTSLKKISALAGAAIFAVLPQSLFACPACFGKSDSAMAQGMNAGIFSLLAVVVTVLIGAAACGIYLVKRAANTSLSEAAENTAAPFAADQNLTK